MFAGSAQGKAANFSSEVLGSIPTTGHCQKCHAGFSFYIVPDFQAILGAWWDKIRIISLLFEYTTECKRSFLVSSSIGLLCN